jgi:hypothetical protein
MEGIRESVEKANQQLIYTFFLEFFLGRLEVSTTRPWGRSQKVQ